jgi:hypothetical protein
VKVAEKKWAYTLYQFEDQYVLSVVCGGAAMYELNIPLSSEEAEKAISSKDYLDRLAASIRDEPDKFSSKSIQL